VFRVHGLDCAEEVVALKRELGPVVGGADRLSFEILHARMTVAPDADVSAEAVIQGVAAAGLRAEPWRDRPVQAPSRRTARHGRTALTAASGAATAAGLAAHAWLGQGLAAALDAHAGSAVAGTPAAALACYAVAVACGMAPVVPKALRSVLHFRADMNVLMSVAVAGAATIGEWLEAATVAFLFSLSLALEAWSVGRARRAVAALLDLSPPTARLRRPDGTEETVAAEDVAVGARFVVHPGERIPLDGHVVAGTSEVNQAPITGESLPVVRQPGDTVFAGTVNGTGALEVVSNKPAAETTLAHIIQMVGQAQARRAPSERWVERFAGVYTPTVIVLAVLMTIVPPLLAGGSWAGWFYRALVLLVVACPCALVISTPVTILSALAAAARRGVLIKGGLHVETPSRLAAVAFDKTGTVTEGRPAVAELFPLSGHDEAELLARAAALEARSDHPIAQAIVQYARRRSVTVAPAADVRILPGRGVTGTIGGREYWLWSHRYLEERNEETPEVHQMLESMAGAGRTVVAVGDGVHVCGLISLADAVRPGTAGALAELRSLGVRRVVMLTGDNRPTAEAIARQLDIDDVRAELLPGDKVAAVERLVLEHGTVAMIGDGVNDAPAMARSSLAIAMGAAGSDAAIETADVALMADDLGKVPWLVRHSRRTLAVLRQNVTLALGVKAVFLALAAADYASLWGAIAADMGASLVVISNGLRLLGDGRASPQADRPRRG
jgi:Cd2+/Zn2+-exporting ATPase